MFSCCVFDNHDITDDKRNSVAVNTICIVCISKKRTYSHTHTQRERERYRDREREREPLDEDSLLGLEHRIDRLLLVLSQHHDQAIRRGDQHTRTEQRHDHDRSLVSATQQLALVAVTRGVRDRVPLVGVRDTHGVGEDSRAAIERTAFSQQNTHHAAQHIRLEVVVRVLRTVHHVLVRTKRTAREERRDVHLHVVVAASRVEEEDRAARVVLSGEHEVLYGGIAAERRRERESDENNNG